MFRQAVLMCAMLCPGLALAQDATAGRELYGRYCASCHGVEGDGMGPMRPVLMVAPTDLSRLTKRNAGTFPLARVLTRIDGTAPVVSHGDEMPVYGDFFASGRRVEMVGAAGNRLETTSALADLVTYLQTLQD